MFSKIHKAREIVLFIGPALIALFIMMVFPIIYILYNSLTNANLANPQPANFVGLNNFINIMTDERFVNALLKTMIFTIGAVGLQCILGTIIAIFMNEEFKGKGFFRTIFVIPMMVAPVVVGLAFLMIMNPSFGVLNQLLSFLGLSKINWLASGSTVIPSLILIDTWQWTPLIMLIVLGGLSMQSKEVLEAATIDGSNTIQLLRYIVLPFARPFIIIAALFRSIDAIKTFDIIYTTTSGGPGFSSETMNIFIYRQAFVYTKTGYASALLIIYFLIILLVTMVMYRNRRAKNYN
ncbi:MAG: carbohydrate ABC transporter permease [Candidatus Humimicrobiaceae bacterium]